MSLLPFTVYRVLHRLSLLYRRHVLKAHSITPGPRACGDQGTCNQPPSHCPDGPSAQTAWLAAWHSALCMKLELKIDCSCLLAVLLCS